jgi:hypothetical protein
MSNTFDRSGLNREITADPFNQTPLNRERRRVDLIGRPQSPSEPSSLLLVQGLNMANRRTTATRPDSLNTNIIRKCWGYIPANAPDGVASRLIIMIIRRSFRLMQRSWVCHEFLPPLKFNVCQLSLSKSRAIQNALARYGIQAWN